MVQGKPYLFLLARIENGDLTALHAQPVDHDEIDSWILYEEDEPYIRKKTWDGNDHTFVYQYSDDTCEWEELSYARRIRFPTKKPIRYPEYLIVSVETDADGRLQLPKLAAADSVEEAYQFARDSGWIGMEGAGQCFLYTYCYGDHGSGQDEWTKDEFPARLQRRYSDGTELHFVQGTFDHFCAELRYQNAAGFDLPSWWPKNTWLHAQLITYADGKQLWKALVDIADQATADTTDLMGFVRPIIKDTVEEQILFDVTYAFMVAEEQKTARDPVKNPLGKRIKLLGAHLVLFEQWSPADAANLQDVLNELPRVCRDRGF